MKILHRMLISLMYVLSLSAHADHVGFLTDSLDQIESQYAGEPFLLVIWEINCFPCHEELETLGMLKQSHPDLNLVLVGTDNIGKQQEIDAILSKHSLTEVDSWLFADPNIERLRYSIDPEWFGELPRNYFYDANSSRIGLSGKLTRDILLQWLTMK
ncbi:MAG: hypothetical protein ACI9XC_000948 [Gammaproteobacteria bacterium]|jgi:hypothetical protein